MHVDTTAAAGGGASGGAAGSGGGGVYHLINMLPLQVDAEAYDTCDVDPAKTLVEWSRPSVDSSVVVPHLSPGTYYFICGVAGHCRAGMKLQVVVYPLTILPALKTPVEAVCYGQCVFAYTPEDTPRLRSVNVSYITGVK